MAFLRAPGQGLPAGYVSIAQPDYRLVDRIEQRFVHQGPEFVHYGQPGGVQGSGGHLPGVVQGFEKLVGQVVSLVLLDDSIAHVQVEVLAGHLDYFLAQAVPGRHLDAQGLVVELFQGDGTVLEHQAQGPLVDPLHYEEPAIPQDLVAHPLQNLAESFQNQFRGFLAKDLGE